MFLHSVKLYVCLLSFFTTVRNGFCQHYQFTESSGCPVNGTQSLFELLSANGMVCEAFRVSLGKLSLGLLHFSGHRSSFSLYSTKAFLSASQSAPAENDI